MRVFRRMFFGRAAALLAVVGLGCGSPGLALAFTLSGSASLDLSSMLGNVQVVAISGTPVLTWQQQSESMSNWVYSSGSYDSDSAVSSLWGSALESRSDVANASARGSVFEGHQQASASVTVPPSTQDSVTAYAGASVSRSGEFRIDGGEAMVYFRVLAGAELGLTPGETDAAAAIYTSGSVGSSLSLTSYGSGWGEQHQGLSVYDSWSLAQESVNSAEKWLGVGLYFGDGENGRIDGWASASTQGSSGQYAVPIPAAGWLFGSALVGLIGIARKRVA